MKIIDSIKARYGILKLKKFNKTKYSKALRELKNMHSNEICFIIGNGPSLSYEDLDVLHKNKVVTFAFNRIYLIFDKTKWRPDYYISQDEKILIRSVDQINDMNLDYKFIPLNYKYYFDVDIKGAKYFKIIPSEKGKYHFSDDISKYVGNSGTVVFTATQLASYMGFKKIYLIGVDHSFNKYRNDNGDILIDKKSKDYFIDDYNKDKNDLYIPNLDESTRTFLEMKKCCEARGIEVYNATRGGKLEVFPRVCFDDLFK